MDAKDEARLKALEILKSMDYKDFEFLILTKKDVKNKLKIKDLIVKMNTILDVVKECGMEQYDKNVVKFVCQTIEHTIVKGHLFEKTGNEKKEVALCLLKPLFNNDAVLVERFIDLALKEISHSTVVTRNKQRASKWCSFFFGMLCNLRGNK